MVSYYGYELWRHKQQVIKPFLSDIVDKMRRITYLCVILHVKHKKWPILAVFTRFLILMAAKMATKKVVTSQASNSATTDKVYFVS